MTARASTASPAAPHVEAQSTNQVSAHGPAAVAALVAETLVVLAIVAGKIGWLIFVAAHFGIVAILGARAATVGRRGGNAAQPMLTAIAVAATGPIGAAGALLIMIVTSLRREDPSLLKAWYARIALSTDVDEVTLLCEAVTTGRTADLALIASKSFAAVMQTGSLADRQTALGVIARKFHPDYLPALLLALKSAEPIIRVQAAAVATRIRPQLRGRVHRAAALSETASYGTVAGLAAEMAACASSGLLDEGDRLRAEVIQQQLHDRAAAIAGNRKGDLGAKRSSLDRDANEGLLLQQRQFKALRVSRRLAAVAMRGRYRVRRPRATSRARHD